MSGKDLDQTSPRGFAAQARAREFLRALCAREDLLAKQIAALGRLAALNEERADCLEDDRARPYVTMAANYHLLIAKLTENHLADVNMIYQDLKISTLDFPPQPKYADRQRS